MHSEKVPYYILDLLQQVPSVYVQGLGRFDAIFHPAVIDLQQSQIKPPYIQPDFIPWVESEMEILPTYIHYVSGIEIDAAKETIAAFVEGVIRRIDTGEPYSIEKFGTFSKSALNILHFTPDWDAFNLSFNSLKVIDLHPVTERKEPQEEIKAPNPLPVISDYSPVEVETEKIETDLVPVEIAEVPIIEDQQENVPPRQGEVSESTSRLAWIILTIALMLITVLCAYLAWDIISGRKRINQITQVIPDTLIITNEFDIPVVMDTVSNPVVIPPIEQKDTIQQPIVQEESEPPCYIVVGAFTNTDNIERMVKQIEGFGYKSTKLKGGALTRVAISTSCDKANLQKVLSEAKSGINPEAWIY